MGTTLNPVRSEQHGIEQADEDEDRLRGTRCRDSGWSEVGVYEWHGKLDGVWRDVVIVERQLGPLKDWRIKGC